MYKKLFFSKVTDKANRNVALINFKIKKDI